MHLRFLTSRTMRQEADANPGTGKPNEGPPPAADPESAAKLAEAKKEADKLRKRLTAAEKADADRKAAEDEAARKKAVENGKAAELLTETEQKLKAVQEEKDRAIKALTDRAQRQVDKLQESERERLNAYKDRVDPSVWLDMVDDAVEASRNVTGQERKPAPPAPGNEGKQGERLIGADATEWLDNRTWSPTGESVVDTAARIAKKVEIKNEDGSISRKMTFPIINQLKERGTARDPEPFIKPKK